MGLFYYEGQKNIFYKSINDEVNEMFTYLAYELADVKYILLDVDACTRGLAGIKKFFNYNDLPSIKYKNKVITEKEKEETEEERLARHKKFFNELKKSFSK